MRSLATLTLLLALVDVDAGLAAYAAGEYERAHALLGEAVQAAGDSAAPELLYDRALAALRVGALDEALAAADAAAAEGEPEFVAYADFVHGWVAYARCRSAARLIDRPEAEPFLLEQALIQAGAARDAFRRAAMSRADWPAARRNAERAARALAALEAKRDEQRAAEEQLAPPPPPPPEPEGESEERETEQAAEPELSASELEQLLLDLQREEQEKRALRRARRAERSLGVERDW